MDLKAKLKSLGRDSLVYGVGAIVAKSLGFFLLPVYTAYFATEIYGRLDLINTITALLASVAMLGLDSAKSFFFNEQKQEGPEAQARAISAIVQMLVPSCLAVAGAAFLGLGLLNRSLKAGGYVPAAVVVFAAGSVIAMNLANFAAGIFRLLYQPWQFLILTLGASVASAGAGLWFIFGCGWGITGFFAGNFIGALIAALAGLWMIRGWLTSVWRPQKAWCGRILRFALPVMPMGLIIWLMHSMDRWFLAVTRPDGELGLYAVGAKFAVLIGLAVNVFRDAWWPHALEAMYSSDGPALYRMIGRGYAGLSTAGLVILAGVAPLLVRLMTAPSYHASWPMVAVLAGSSVCYGGYLIYSPGIWKTERTGLGLAMLAGSVVLNAILCVLLVPRFGIMGASISTALAFFAWLAGACFISEKLWPVGFPVARLLGQVVAAIAGISLVTWIHHQEATGWAGLASSVVVAVALAVAALSPAEWRRGLAALSLRKSGQTV